MTPADLDGLAALEHALNNMRIRYHRTRLTRDLSVDANDIALVFDKVPALIALARRAVPGGGEDVSDVMRRAATALTPLAPAQAWQARALSAEERVRVLEEALKRARSQLDAGWPARSDVTLARGIIDIAIALHQSKGMNDD